MLFAFKYLDLVKHSFVIFQLISHKILRWLQPIFFILILIATLYQYIFANSELITLFILVQFIFYIIAIVGLFFKIPGTLGKILNIPTYFIVVNAASLNALYLTFTSKLEATWETNEY